MAKPDHSLDPLILASARREFLEKGFEKASLERICENANVTTGALYKRYSGKEELFAAALFGRRRESDVAADPHDRSIDLHIQEFVSRLASHDRRDALPQPARRQAEQRLVVRH